MKLSRSILAAAALVVPFGYAAATDLDLTGSTSTGVLNGATFTTSSSQSTGTGVIDPFVRLQDNGIADGFNATVRPVMPDVNTSPTFTHDLMLSAVPIVMLGTVAYREFLLDINQTAASPLLSLDQLQIRLSATAATTANTLASFSALGSLVYNLDAGGDNAVLLDYSKNSGSGSGDLFVYVPDSAFLVGGEFVYMYSSFGEKGGVYAENDGFEEWATRNPTAPVPEPGTYALMLAGLGVVGFMARRRKQQA